MDVHPTKNVSIGIDPYPLVDFNHQIESIGWGCETKKQYPLVIEHNNITIEHGPWIVDLPTKTGDFLQQC